MSHAEHHRTAAPAAPAAPAARATSRRVTREQGWLIGGMLLVAVVALLPRLFNLGGFLTHDEGEFWLDRSNAFLRAIQSGDFGATAISTHPGVTTMWLGSIGIVMRRALFALGWLADDSFATYLAALRLPVVLLHAAALVVGYRLLHALLPPALALLAAVLWAADPFVIGYSRLLHVDALLATFATLSLLAAAYYWLHAPRRWALLLSGACAALAVLSKSPGLALLPMIGGLALLAPPPGMGMAGRVRMAVPALLAWGVAYAATALLVYPALWAAPLRVYELLRLGVEAEGAQPHMTGNFFLGREVEVPGLLYYPVTVALRLTPITLVGVLLLPFGWHRLAAHHRRVLLVLLLWVLLLVAAFSIFPKQFNRYLVPAFPALDVLAAAGLYAACSHARLWVWLAPARRRLVQGAAAVVLVLAVVANALGWHPYYIAGFNQLLGGAPAGARTFQAGWGEGMEQAAAWLNEQPDITGKLTAAVMIKLINPYLIDGARADTPRTGDLDPRTGYVVVYLYQMQGTVFPPFDQFYPVQPPVHTVTIHGVPYAHIYAVPPPVATARPAAWGDTLALRGFTPLDTATTASSDEQAYHLHWATGAPPPGMVWLFAHVVDASGQRVAQIDTPLVVQPWQPGRYPTSELRIPLPPDLPPGDYRVVLGLYDEATGTRLPLQSRHAADPALSGGDALLVETFRHAP